MYLCLIFSEKAESSSEEEVTDDGDSDDEDKSGDEDDKKNEDSSGKFSSGVRREWNSKEEAKQAFKDLLREKVKYTSYIVKVD